MTILQLHKPRPVDDVPETLRRIADEIEAGEVEWPVTTAIVVLGHTDAEVPVDGGALMQQNYWTSYAAGPRVDSFTCKGLLTSVLNRWNHGDE
jgi:hypothetical protein